MDINQSYDFDELMDSVTRFMSTREEFKDMNFEGSSIRQLMRLMAYVAMIQGYESNFLFNELDLATASLRENAASRASTLGYLATGKQAAQIDVNIVVRPSSTYDAPSQLLLERTASFFSNLDGQVISFAPSKTYSADLTDEGTYVFSGVRLLQGSWNHASFECQSSSAVESFIFPSENLDVNTLEVQIFDSASSASGTVVSRFEHGLDLGKDNSVYFLRNTRDGRYELNFGDGRISKALERGNIVLVTGLETKGLEGNGIQTLTPGGPVGGFYDVQIESVDGQRSAGGSEEESIDSIRTFAPLTFASRGRAVNPADYVTAVKELFPLAERVNSWGGEDATPPQHGFVVVAVKPKGAESLTAAQKQELKTKLLTRNVGSITPVIVDADWTYINGVFSVSYDPKRTVLSQQTMRGKINETLHAYSEQVLEKFAAVFDSGKCADFVKACDASITRVLANFTYQKRLRPELNMTGVYTFNFNRQISPNSVELSGFRVTDLNYADFSYFVRDDGLGGMLLEKRRTDGYVEQMKLDMGSVDYVNGVVKISGLRPISFDNGEFMSLEVSPGGSHDQSLDGLRDTILSLGTTVLNVTGNGVK